MKEKNKKPGFRRIALGMAGFVIVIAAGISLAVFTGQKKETEEPAMPQEAQSVTHDSMDEKEESKSALPQEKQEIILWTMQATPILKECVGNFNNGDHGYRVVIHECYGEGQNVSWDDALLRMQMALSGSTGPDIALLDSLDIKDLTQQGMLEDLTPYFAGSERIHQEDFLESVTTSYTNDGKWGALPRWITMQTLWGKPGIVGDTPGWTVQEMLALAERYPNLSMTGQFAQWEFLTYCTAFVPETFWLEPNGEAKEDLKEVLEQTMSYPGQIDHSRWDEQCWQVCQEEVLLTELEVYKLETLFYLQELAGEDGLIPIGYPTLDAAPKALLSPVNGLYAIPANASDKEGAWTFLELFFAGELDPRERSGLFYQASGIPTCKRELEEEFQWELQQWEQQKKEDMDEEQLAIIEEWREELTAMADVYPSFTDSFLDIIGEESAFYFEGVKTLEETLRVIENRGSLYFQENAD
ncbi:MAG: extracellular solute-binding protein [Lachnospiraceae bacterium]|nr:extracellular solute-binding protein [Lachnospiraceae bacterium]MCM1238426.1 extracellular solute-binding protein [Lachnospiraceae bacterium]MCM1303591.1 extracellular solute-binding protein [Butyrivibrio sp.]MCM1343315.1 extracellular solute-binding protein [Muribaculaceae bacterium]MCM1409347.1 extracellular solute-binding protein [Lachnospiraceae bacterium]